MANLSFNSIYTGVESTLDMRFLFIQVCILLFGNWTSRRLDSLTEEGSSWLRLAAASTWLFVERLLFVLQCLLLTFCW